jgi:hypothetical protein
MIRDDFGLDDRLKFHVVEDRLKIFDAVAYDVEFDRCFNDEGFVHPKQSRLFLDDIQFHIVFVHLEFVCGVFDGCLIHCLCFKPNGSHVFVPPRKITCVS